MILEYAKLFDGETGKMAENCERDDLVMGPETARRCQENQDECAVTICCITYHHEQIIRQALDSFLMQKTNFKFKIFVGEDHSPDGTADIVREYAQKYPDQVVAFCREENMGAQRNLVDLCQRANSPYIAFCEGDDYWIDKYKLQKQYDYMQSHPKTRVCFTRTLIEAPRNWHLNNYYRHDERGEMILPECEPSFVTKEYYRAADFVRVFPSHTSSVFYRWNYDLDIPDWYYEGLIGDTPMVLMQMGQGRAVYLPDVSSVYRRSDVGVFMNHSNEEHFINTRLDCVRFLSGLDDYMSTHYHDDALIRMIRSRTGKEINNYLSAAEKMGRAEDVDELMLRFPAQARRCMFYYKNLARKYQQMEGRLGSENLGLLMTKRQLDRGVRCCIRGYRRMQKVRTSLRKCKAWIKEFFVLLPQRNAYWHNARKSKEKDLWVITSFRHKGYVDNTMYFYEYMVEHHPEIRLTWVTTDQKVLDMLKAQGKPVVRMDSPEGTDLISRAAIAITDHFASSDYSPKYGFNAGTKVVQLWHGVGFKSMGDGKQVKNTSEPGVRYSYDILPEDGDGWLRSLSKRIKRWFRAPFRELFEQYFMLVCPGKERTETIGKLWNIPQSAYFMAGHPRDMLLYGQKADPERRKIVYAPTYRFNVKYEKKLVESVLDYAPEIESLMEELDAEFYLRLHPHTWRNYDTYLEKLEHLYDRILVDREQDAYTHLGTYSLLITDYSSIGLDMAQLDRPVIFFCPDYEWYMANEAGFGVDFSNVIPGVMTRSWEETLCQVKKHVQHPEANAEMRHERISYFFDPSVNGPDNSERIAQEIIRRLNTVDAAAGQ